MGLQWKLCRNPYCVYVILYNRWGWRWGGGAQLLHRSPRLSCQLNTPKFCPLLRLYSGMQGWVSWFAIFHSHIFHAKIIFCQSNVSKKNLLEYVHHEQILWLRTHYNQYGTYEANDTKYVSIRLWNNRFTLVISIFQAPYTCNFKPTFVYIQGGGASRTCDRRTKL